MKQSAGSDVFVVFSLLAIFLFTLLILRHYLQLRKTPAYFAVPIFLALALPISIILLLPVDLASSSRSEDEKTRGIWLPEGAVLVGWRIVYWLTFTLTWAILPLLGEYVDSGYRAPKDKFFYSLRSNGRYYLIVFACSGLAGIYIFLQNGFKAGSLKTLVMALAYCYGLIVAIYFMGHGLVSIPRDLLKDANLTGRLRRIQSEASKTHDKRGDAINVLEELEIQLTQLRRRKNAVSQDHEIWIESLCDSSHGQPYSASNSQTSPPQLPAVITDRYLAEFSRKLVRARHKVTRFDGEWIALVDQHVELSAIIDSKSTRKLERMPPSSSLLEPLNILTPYTRYLLHTKFVPAFQLLWAGIFSLLSISVIWSEIVKAISPKLSLISLTTLSQGDRITFRGQLLASLYLLYMALATLSTIPRVKIWGNRALISKNTYPESAAWYSGQVAKLTVPLAYNFLTFFPGDVLHKTSFYTFLGTTINFTPLGKVFDYVFPIFILLPVSAALFNIYGRTSRYFGSSFINADEESGNASALGTGSWREGHDLINRELQTRARTGLNGRVRRTDHSDSNTVGDGQAPPSYTDRPSGPPRQDTNERQASRLAAATQAAAEEDEGFFEGFAHRVKNTFDTAIERPAWFDDIGKKPKWMGGGGDQSRSASGEGGSAGEESTGGLGRWFGGRPAEGRVRLG